jgi:hypothetical protein
VSRKVIGFLAGAGVTLAALVAFAHGPFILVAIAGAAVATGLASYYSASVYAY